MESVCVVSLSTTENDPSPEKDTHKTPPSLSLSESLSLYPNQCAAEIAEERDRERGMERRRITAQSRGRGWRLGRPGGAVQNA